MRPENKAASSVNLCCAYDSDGERLDEDIAKPGNGTELTVGQDGHGRGTASWSHYDAHEASAKVTFDTYTGSLIVEVPLDSRVTIIKKAVL